MYYLGQSIDVLFNIYYKEIFILLFNFLFIQNERKWISRKLDSTVYTVTNVKWRWYIINWVEFYFKHFFYFFLVKFFLFFILKHFLWKINFQFLLFLHCTLSFKNIKSQTTNIEKKRFMVFLFFLVNDSWYFSFGKVLLMLRINTLT